MRVQAGIRGGLFLMTRDAGNRGVEHDGPGSCRRIRVECGDVVLRLGDAILQALLS